jgi:hypothetical protein
VDAGLVETVGEDDSQELTVIFDLLKHFCSIFLKEKYYDTNV